MFLDQDQINTNIRWLLANASAPVQYLTHKFLLKDDPQSEAMAELWKRVQNSRAAEDIFSRQNEDGSWFSGGDWGTAGYRHKAGKGYTINHPKFVTTAWLLPYLGEMGFTTGDDRIRKSCEQMLSEVSYPQLEPGARAANCCGLYGIPLRAFASVGMAGDERIQGGWDWLLHCQRSDGGWLNPNHISGSPHPSKTQGRYGWDRSCAWGSTFAVQALFYSRRPEHMPALSRALAFLLWHLAQKEETHVQTWVYHGHNIVKELLMFSEAGVNMRLHPIPALLSWLKGYYRSSEGMFRTQEKPIPAFTRHISAIMKDYQASYGPAYWETIPKASAGILRYQLYHLIEDDWLTYYLTRIAQNMYLLTHPPFPHWEGGIVPKLVVC
jgi:hypothetical protein